MGWHTPERVRAHALDETALPRGNVIKLNDTLFLEGYSGTKFIDLRGKLCVKSFAWKKLKKLVIATENLYS